MTIDVHVLNESDIRLWGLTQRERICRVLGARGPVREVENLDALPDGGAILLLRGDYLYDNRILERLCEADNTLLRLAEETGEPLVAARVERSLAPRVAAALDGREPLDESLALQRVTTDELVSPFQAQLRKFEPARVYPILPENREQLERHLFDGAYKGITDLVTKWVWPVPARWGVRACIGLGLSPNQVTALNWLLALAAGLLFAAGHFALGLLVGWFMTYLDTVDGKLARVSVASSKLGHFADHILDIVHPPLWYLAWGKGLTSYDPLLLGLPLDAAIWIIFACYIIGRFCEGGFQLWLGYFEIFSWRPVDSLSRLVTARRNPCLILLTCGALSGRPDLGLEAVAVWTLLSTLFLLARVAMGIHQHLRHGALTSWLAEIDPAAPGSSFAERWFAPRAPEAGAGQSKPSPGASR